MGESLRQKPVRKPRVPRQQRAVEVGADRASDATALETRRAVVPEAVNDTSEGLGVAIQHRAAGVVLEPRKSAE